MGASRAVEARFTQQGGAVTSRKDNQERAADDAGSASLVAAQVVELLKAAGIKGYRHVALLTELLGISGHAARRRINGATPFTEEELRVILTRLDFEYRGLYGIQKRGAETPEANKRTKAVNRVAVTVTLNGKPVKALAQLRPAGPWMRAADSTFAVQSPDGSYELRTTAEISDEEQPFAVDSMEIASPFEYQATGRWIAVVDNADQTAIAISKALENTGFRAKPISTPEALEEELAHGVSEAFYVCWDSAPKWHPEQVARRIREAKGACPIVFSGPFGQEAAAATLSEVAVKYDAILLPHLSSTKLIAMTLLREMRGRRSGAPHEDATKLIEAPN